MLEVSIVDFLLKEIGKHDDITARRGTERGYPDIEIGGSRFGGAYHALLIAQQTRGQGST